MARDVVWRYILGKPVLVSIEDLNTNSEAEGVDGAVPVYDKTRGLFVWSAIVSSFTSGKLTFNSSAYSQYLMLIEAAEDF